MGMGIKAEIVDSDYYHWIAKINGLTGTSWEGGIFAVELLFSREYDSYPPKVTFLTIPFHPNIDMSTGKPCVDFLDNPDLWVPGTTLTGLLQSLQLLLVEPVLEDAVNIFAAQAFLNSPHLYNQLVKDCVVASCKVEAGISPYNESYNEEEAYENTNEESNESENNNNNNDSNKKVLLSSENTQKIKKISFEDYYKDWMNSATFLPKLNESRFKRYSNNNEDYVVRRTNNNQEFIQHTNKVDNPLKKCVVHGVKVNENIDKSLKNTNNTKYKDKSIKTSFKPDIAKKDESKKLTTENQTEESKSKVTEKSSSLIEKVMENIKKHEFTYIIDQDTDRITYIRKFFGELKNKIDSEKSFKKATTITNKRNEEQEMKNEIINDRERDLDQNLGYHHHSTSLNYDHVYHAMMSNHKNKNEIENFDCQNKPMVNIRDSRLYQYKFGHRYLKVVDIKEFKKKLSMSLTKEEKEILDKITQNEKYYNMFLNELEEIQMQKEMEKMKRNNVNDPENEDNNIYTDKKIKNENNLAFRDNILQIRAKPGTTENDYSLSKDQKEIIINGNEKSIDISPNMDPTFGPWEQNIQSMNEKEQEKNNKIQDHHENEISDIADKEIQSNRKIVEVFNNKPTSPLKVSNDNVVTNDFSNEKNNVNINNSSLKNNLNVNGNDNNLNIHSNSSDKDKTITNGINADTMNKSNNTNKNITSETEKLLNGEYPDGILDWCDNLDQTNLDNIGLI
jgi:ubiquitin-protein ligase